MTLNTIDDWYDYCATMRNVVLHTFYYQRGMKLHSALSVPSYPCEIETEIRQSVTDGAVWFAFHYVKELHDRR